jgi:methanogenic corrinoid protein MtbC1
MTREHQLTVFIECLEQGDRRRCFNLVKEWEQQRLPNDLLYNDILIPALVHIGTAWEHNRQGIVEEHVATQIIKAIVASKATAVEPKRSLGKTALVGCVPDEQHELASMLMANSLEEDGWNVRHYGSSVPAQDLLSAAAQMKPDLVCLSMKSIGCLESTVQLLTELRKVTPASKIMLGGMHMPAVRAVLSEHADIIADTFLDGVREASRLADID